MLKFLGRGKRAGPDDGNWASAEGSGASSPISPSPARSRRRTGAPGGPLDGEDSDDSFFEETIKSVSDDDFLLSPEKVTSRDIDSIQDRPRAARSLPFNSPPSGLSQSLGSYGSGLSDTGYWGGGSSSGMLAGSGGSGTMFGPNEEDQSWLVAAPASSSKTSGSAFMDSSPPRRANGRPPSTQFMPSPSRIPSYNSSPAGASRIPRPGPGAYPSPAASPGHTRIPSTPSPTKPSTARVALTQQYQETPSNIPGAPSGYESPYQASPRRFAQPPADDSADEYQHSPEPSRAVVPPEQISAAAMPQPDYGYEEQQEEHPQEEYLQQEYQHQGYEYDDHRDNYRQPRAAAPMEVEMPPLVNYHMYSLQESDGEEPTTPSKPEADADHAETVSHTGNGSTVNSQPAAAADASAQDEQDVTAQWRSSANSEDAFAVGKPAEKAPQHPQEMKQPQAEKAKQCCGCCIM